jgi:hypothetical protein
MEVTLDKEDFINMICGTDPSVNMQKYLEDFAKFDEVTGWRFDRFYLKKLSRSTLYDIYLSIKTWKDD